MFAFCTYCSHHKSSARGDLPAIRRYRSKRIARVYRAARIVGARPLILSAEFGLLPPEQPIPWYDHLLEPGEIRLLAERAADQLQQNHIIGVAYFTVALDRDPQVKPYQDVIVAACNRTAIPLLLMELPFD